jgi:hypothetical protein
MKASTFTLKDMKNAGDLAQVVGAIEPQVVFMFGSLDWLRDDLKMSKVAAMFPGAACFGCSTAGEISGVAVDDGSLSLMGLKFESAGARVGWAIEEVSGVEDSEAAGRRLASGLSAKGLRHVLMVGPGTNVNGSGLIVGARSALPDGCTLSGGLAGDAGTFAGSHQWAMGKSGDRMAYAIGFYGEELDIRCSCRGGWKPFGPARKATKVDGNVLMELDGESALSIYKRYLGRYAKDLPGSGLLFPFENRSADNKVTGIIRTILGVDEAAGSLMLAGDVEPGGYLTLMHANTDGLAIGSESAAKALGPMPMGGKALVAISCVGRKLVMGARVDEEIEALMDVVGTDVNIAGFYSNGEICGSKMDNCSLHNQTMTLTMFAEK